MSSVLCSLLLLGQGGITAAHLVPIGLKRGELWPHYQEVGMSCSLLGLPWCYQVGLLGRLVSASTWGPETAPHSAFPGMGRGGATVLSVVLAGMEQLLSKHFLSCEAASFLVLRLERAGFCWGCFCLCLLVFALLASSVPSLGCVRKKENPGTSLPCCP